MRISSVCIILTGMIWLAPYSLAQRMDSTKYTVDWFIPMTSNGGGTVISPRYAVDFTMGQTVIGQMSSKTYSCSLGFWYSTLREMNASITPSCSVMGIPFPTFNLIVNGETPPLEIQWSTNPSTGFIDSGTSITLTSPKPSQTISIHVQVSDAEKNIAYGQARLLVAQNPIFFDFLEDGCNNLGDLWKLIQLWRQPYQDDPNGDDFINILDLLYINLDDPTPCSQKSLGAAL